MAIPYAWHMMLYKKLYIRRDDLTYKIFNASNILGAIAFMAMMFVPAAYEGEMYITAVVLLATFAGCSYLSMKEDGQIR